VSDLAQELHDARAREAATSEILRVISRSPTNYQPVFDTILESATRLCNAPLAMLLMRREDGFHLVAHVGARPETVEYLRDNPVPFDVKSSGTMRAAIDRQPNQLADITADAAYQEGLEHRKAAGDIEGIRTALWVPIVKGDECVGVICVYRREVRPFDESQIALVSTFADQAVIAIDNVRLFQALETRTEELGESLERQTATSGILRTISRSPTDYGPVFDVILDNATRLCEAPLAFLLMHEGDHFRLVADKGSRPEFVEWMESNPIPASEESSFTARAAAEKVPVQVRDFTETELYRDSLPHPVASAELEGIRSALIVPMIKDDDCVGVIAIYRREVRPFDESQIALVSTFADQAVIAIDNVRLFQALQARTDELGEALERQTATSDILRTISRSPTDYGPVFDAILDSATRLCEAPLAILLIREGEHYQLVAHWGTRPEFVNWFHSNPIPVDAEHSFAVRVATEGVPLQIPDFAETEAYRGGARHQVAGVEIEGIRSALLVPMMKGDDCAGVIAVYRREVRSFDETHIGVVTTFADQAVIAIDNVNLFQELERRNKVITEALEQQTATTEVLKIISRSTFDLEPVLETLIENATRLCHASWGVIHRFDGKVLRAVGAYGATPEFMEYWEQLEIGLDRGSALGRAALEKRTVHIEDVLADPEYTYSDAQARGGWRTVITVPMIREGELIGVMALIRNEVNAFTDKQVELVSTFADQAAIAIENVRLFDELEARNRDLGESLERQTATSDILRTISRSPTDYGPVFDAILENATRLCDAPLAFLMMREGDHFQLVAHRGSRAEFVEWLMTNPISVDSPLLVSRAATEGKPLQLADITENYRKLNLAHRSASVEVESIRSMLSVPMMKGDECVGVVSVYRREIRPFDESHIALISTFADQAVIAIDNVRLFQALEARTDELGEALERQTATSDILRTISRSPTDYGPVFDAILASATRLCDAPLGYLLMREEDHFHYAAHHGSRPEFVEWAATNPVPVDSPLAVVRDALEGVPQKIDDVTDSEFYRDGAPHRVASADIEGVRSALFAPMMNNEKCVGIICIHRREVRPFDDGHIDLVSTFADQAVIAIDNVRLFQALEARTDELGDALERQTATSDILRTISRSPTDYGPVFDAILDSATRLCDAPLAFLTMREDDQFKLVAHKGSRPEFVEWTTANPIPVDSPLVLARAAAEGKPRQLTDITDTDAYREGQLTHRVAAADLEGVRCVLFVPMMKGDDCVGVIAVYRREVRPFDESHIALVSTFADQAVIAIDNVRLFQALDERTRELARSVDELRALGEIGQAVSSSLELETVLNTIINQAVALTGTDGGLISEYDEATGTLPHRAAPGFEMLVEEAGPVRLGEGAIGRAAESRAPVQIPDIDAAGAYMGRLRGLLDRAGLKALLAVPLLREDRVLGALLVARKTPGEFPPGTVELLGTFAAQSALAIHNARLFRELEEKGRELAQANQHKSEFLANMSHELRTPLNAVIGFSEVLGEEMFGELNEKQSEYVDDIHTSGRHLLSLINDILDLSKIEAGRMELDLSTFDIREALGNALTLVGERAQRRGISLESEIDESLADMTGDERKIKQILLNLLSNAIKFTPEGGHVTLAARGVDSALEIAVCDTGVGISAEDQERIFEEFRQVGTDYARKVEGTGLGLTLTRRFVELHGGAIVVKSELGAGSEFRITLPLEPPEAALAGSG